MNAVRTFVIHLRVPFQLALAPFFLLGSWLSGAAPDRAWLAVFLLVHVGLYGGATVYNSFYDRDEGPIGMLKRPPPVPASLLRASIVLQSLSVAAVWLLATPAGVVASALAVMGVAYSRPWPRLKGRTYSGLATVALGQGLLAVLLGYYAATTVPPSTTVWLYGAVASALVLGLYPLTQIYQIDEDAQRGDMTVPVRFGWKVAMAFSAAVAGPALVVLVFLMRGAFAGYATVVIAALVVGAGLYFWDWWRRFEGLGPSGNHDRAMLLSIGMALPMGGLLLAELIERLT